MSSFIRVRNENGQVVEIPINKVGKSAYEIALKHGFDGTEEEWVESLKGEQGKTGTGITNIEKTSVSGLLDTYTITFTDNTTTTFTVTNGKAGTNGTNGTNGTSVTVSSVTESTESGGENVVEFSDGNTLTVKNGNDGKTPVKGTDYFTPEEKNEIIQAILAELGAAVIGYIDGNTITLKGALAEGTYAAYYEVTDEEGNKNLIEIGELTLAESGVTPDPVKYTVTFVADGVTVAEIKYAVGDTIDVPEVPAKAGYTGAWNPYDLSNGGDITVNAVYTAIETDPAEPTNFFKATPAVTDKSQGSEDAVLLGGRLGSDSTYRDDGGPDCLLTNYIHVQSGDIVEMTNLAFNALISAMYDSDKTLIGAFTSSNASYITDLSTSGEKQTFTIANANAGYIRVSGQPNRGIKVNTSGADVSLRYDLTQIVINVKRNGAYL